MIILVASKIDQANIHHSLGKPEYSYFFLMKDFIPVLRQLGEVRLVASTEEVETLYRHHRAQGDDVIFISFSPPHQAPLALECPTLLVFAWEFDSLPCVAWDDNPQNDWRYALGKVQGALCTSQEAADLVAEAMPVGYPVIALPAPVWDRYNTIDTPGVAPFDCDERQFFFSGVVIDSPILGLSADGLVRKPADPVDELLEASPESLTTPAEDFSAWQLSKALFKGWWREVRLPYASPGLVVQPLEPVKQKSVEVSLKEEPLVAPVIVRGVVYTTVLNPADSRKNWVEIITAFCWAFKNTEDATLIVKMTHHDLEYYRIVLMTLLSRLAPFSCRVIVLHGFLEDEQYRELIKASTYYVNASSGEGLCLPLMEFLCSRKPAIAPDHTAMADYVEERMAFILKTTLEPFCWPHDPTGIFTTHRHRLNWQSLMEAFQASYQVVTNEPDRYRAMAQHACEAMREFASIDVVAAPLNTLMRALIGAAEQPSTASGAEARP